MTVFAFTFPLAWRCDGMGGESDGDEGWDLEGENFSFREDGCLEMDLGFESWEVVLPRGLPSGKLWVSGGDDGCGVPPGEALGSSASAYL